MEQGQMVQVVQPRSNWFVEPWRHYGPILWHLLPMILIVYVPMEIFGAFLERLIGSTGSTTRDIMMSVRLANVLESLIGIIAVVGITLAVRDRREGQMEGWGYYLKKGCSLWGRAMAANILGCLIVGALSLLCIVPGVIAGVYLAWTMEAAVLLDLSATQALSESRQMVTGHWWLSLGMLMVISVVTGGMCGGVALPLGFLSGVMEGVAEEAEGVALLLKILASLVDVVGGIFVDLVGIIGPIFMAVSFLRLREGRGSAPEVV